MKLILSAMFASLLAAPLALADGCDKCKGGKKDEATIAQCDKKKDCDKDEATLAKCDKKKDCDKDEATLA